MGKHFITATLVIAGMLLTACAQPNGSPGRFEAPADGVTWEWRSNGAFPKTVVLTLNHDKSATLETWDTRQASDLEASYRIETGGARWIHGRQFVTFSGRVEQPLEIEVQPDGTLSAWWLPAGKWSTVFEGDRDEPPAVEPDMKMQRVFSPEWRTRPVDIP
jgi:hypothetical protein